MVKNMINITKEKLSNYQLHELEQASKNLPEKIIIRCQDAGIDSSNFDLMNTFFFPHDLENGFFSKERYILNNSRITNWGDCEYRNRFDKKETYLINFSRIPDNYKMIDIYHFNVIQDNSVDFFVAKRDNDDIRVLFGYSSNPLNESLYNNIFVGSFAKTDS